MEYRNLTIIKNIFEGERTVVNKAKDNNGNFVIIKSLKEEYPLPTEILKLKNEFEIINNIHGSGIIKPIRYIQENRNHAIVFRDIGGETLSSFLRERKPSLGVLLTIASMITESLMNVHKHDIIHKDIKPQNIIINPESLELEIADFGISSMFSKETLSIESVGRIEGTLSYISPEQTGRMNRSIDYRSDFYSLGVTLYEMFTGKLPFYSNDALEMIYLHIASIPIPPEQLNTKIPHPLSKLIMKLLEKNAENRYKSAKGILYDLNKINELYSKNIPDLPYYEIAEKDTSDKFAIPQKLYGRKKQIEILEEALKRVTNQKVSKSEFIIIKGNSGVGKTNLVKEIQKSIALKQGFFLQGKFEQFEWDTPYKTIIELFQQLVTIILMQSEDKVKMWKDSILNIVGENGHVLVEVIPELELIIGKQHVVKELSLKDAQNRFVGVLKDFIKIFISELQPLVVFLDDMQWIDLDSSKLMLSLFSDLEMVCTLFIFSYRDNEVESNHPLMLLLQEIQNTNIPIQTINLFPLSFEDLNQLIADTLQKNKEEVSELAELVLSKTHGNPFFVTEVLKTMDHEKIVYYEQSIDSWLWDIQKAKSLDVTDNVISLMIHLIMNLSPESQKLIQMASCISNRFSLKILSIINQKSVFETLSQVSELLREGLLVLEINSQDLTTEDSNINRHIYLYFLHDKVQQAAYETIPDSEKQQLHLQIGRHLANYIFHNSVDEHIIETVNHYNIARNLIVDLEERIKLVELNLRAAKKTKETTAYHSCYEYLYVCIELLPENCWDKFYSLSFEVYKFYLNIEYMVGSSVKNDDSFLGYLLSKLKTDIEKVEVYNIVISKYMLQGKNTDVIKVGKLALSLLGLHVPEENMEDLTNQELWKIQSHLKENTISSLVDLPEMTNSEMILAMKVLINMNAPAYLSFPPLYAWILTKMVNLSLEYGNTKESAKGYASFGNVWIANFQDFQGGFEFGLLGLKLSQKLDDPKQKCQAYFSLSFFLNHWVNHMNDSIQWEEEGYQTALDCGDIHYAGYILVARSLNSFFRTKNMVHLFNELQDSLKWCKKYRHIPSTNAITAISMVVSQLLSRPIDQNTFIEEEFLLSLQKNKNFLQLCIFYTLEGIYYFLLDDFETSLSYLREAKSLHKYATNLIIISEYYFYHSLTLLSLLDNVNLEDKNEYIEEVKSNQIYLKNYSNNCKENFLHKYFLIEAELEVFQENTVQALNLFEKSMNMAGENGFHLIEAIANERIANYFISIGSEKAAKNYIQDARYLFQQMGVNSKVDNINIKFGNTLKSFYFKNKSKHIYRNFQVNDSITLDEKTDSNLIHSKHLDFNSIFKAARSLSKEIVLENLIKKLMKFLLQNAGAENGIFLFNQDGKLSIEAISKRGKEIETVGSISIDRYDNISHSIINLAKRTQNFIVLDNASVDGQFINDPYIKNKKIKSVICLPVTNKGKLLAMIYLENNITEGAFTIDRIEALQILASQAAISIENAKLYESIETITRKQTKIQTEFEIAEDIQTSLVPKNPKLLGYNIAVYMETADKVGGDYYDVINQEDRDWLIIGDVSGHGVQAGIVMIMVQTAIHTIVEFQRELAPEDVLKEVNKIITTNIQKMNSNKYMTILLMEKVGDTFYFSGQHLEIIVYRARYKIVERIRTEDCWIGLHYMIDEFSKRQFSIESGDTFILYTDGITEALDKSENMFETEGIVNIMQNYGEKPVEEIKHVLLNALTSYHKKDDVTFMIVKKV